METITKYPLHWPPGQPRTPKHKQQRANFKGTMDKNRRELMEEIRRLGGRDVILSTNLKLRLDGAPYASQRAPDDIGVAVYFKYRDRPMCFACDKWQTMADNIKAITKTIEAIRGVERWGSSDMMERAFSGFEALPSPKMIESNWWDILECCQDSPKRIIDLQYKRLRRDHHPDLGGDPNKFDLVVKAYKKAISECEG